jgi:hypothetical protein
MVFVLGYMIALSHLSLDYGKFSVARSAGSFVASSNVRTTPCTKASAVISNP